MCGDIVRHIALISALMTPSLIEFCLSAGLGLGQTTHHSPVADDEPGRKGISCERTFRPMSQEQELEDMVGAAILGIFGHMESSIFGMTHVSSPHTRPHTHYALSSLSAGTNETQCTYCISHSQASSLVSHLCGDMASEGLEGRTITLKIKLVSFEIRTRAATLPTYASKPDEMLPAVYRCVPFIFR